MNQECQFWLNWIVNVFLALTTLGAVLVALWGDVIKRWLFPVKLKIRLLNPKGDITKTALPNQKPGESPIPTRYYLLRVSNERRGRWPTATDVRVDLLRIEMPASDGQYMTAWQGSVPLNWRHQTVFPRERKIGSDADCDLCSVVKGEWLALHPMLMPFTLEEFARCRDPIKMRLFVRACSVEGDSPTLQVDISWNGKWVDGAEEMQRHMSVSASPIAAK